ncbi:hypothetical protein SynA18461_01916 [Synechococcus sp. A18-46.1]|nr:hypothetical protein SynA18461_01916 [Synechococcus sp. A18-46.1]
MIEMDSLHDYLLGATDQDLDNIANTKDYGGVGGLDMFVIAHTIATFIPGSAEVRTTRYGNKYCTLSKYWRSQIVDYYFDNDCTKIAYVKTTANDRKGGAAKLINRDRKSHYGTLQEVIESLTQEEQDLLRSILIERLQCETSEIKMWAPKQVIKTRPLADRKRLIVFVENVLQGQAGCASAVQVLTDELLDPSFVIKGPQKKAILPPKVKEETKEPDRPPTVEKVVSESKEVEAVPPVVKEELKQGFPAESLPPESKDDLDVKEGREVLKELLEQRRADAVENLNEMRRVSKDADVIWQKARKKRSKTSRKRNMEGRESEALHYIRRIAIDECETRLLENYSKNIMVFERAPFETEVRKSVCGVLTDEEIKECGDMLLLRLGNGIQFGYLRFGLKKMNRGWYLNDQGKVVIDLRNVLVE